MVGLNELGDLAFEVEKEHNRVLEDDRPATPALLALIDVALQSFREWVDTLRRTGRVKANTAPLRAALAQMGSSSSSAQVSPAASEASTAPPFPERDLSPAATPALALAPRAPPNVSMIEVIEQDETALPEIDRPDGDSTPAAQSAEIIEFKPISSLHATAAIQAASESLPGEPDEITVGDVTLSSALFRILCDEAQQHLATLDYELKALQSDWTATPSQAMVRAGHTLCGIHRTGGFPLVATVAKALEVCLLGLQERGAPLPGAAQPVLARAIAGLTVFTARVRARDGFRPADESEGAEIIAELDALRQEASS